MASFSCWVGFGRSSFALPKACLWKTLCLGEGSGDPLEMCADKLAALMWRFRGQTCEQSLWIMRCGAAHPESQSPEWLGASVLHCGAALRHGNPGLFGKAGCRLREVVGAEHTRCLVAWLFLLCTAASRVSERGGAAWWITRRGGLSFHSGFRSLRARCLGVRGCWARMWQQSRPEPSGACIAMQDACRPAVLRNRVAHGAHC